MRDEIIKDREFYIISRVVDNAEKCIVCDVCEDYFKVKLRNPRSYEPDEAVEMFAMTPEGQLYFETIVKDMQEDIICLWYPFSSQYLQRREYTRINTDNDITLQIGKNNVNVKVSDLSAGGLKVVTKEPLELLKEYPISICVENNNIKAGFQPFRIEAVDNGFVSSGKFNNITNHDRIALVQYCFRKQIENNTL